MEKIVFFDIDGTLLDENKSLPASAKEAIYTLQEKGIYTAIATGRAPFMIDSLLKELNIHSYVCFNGQYVVFEDQVISTNPIDTEILGEIERTAANHDHSIVYMNEETLKTNSRYNERIQETLGTLKLAYPEYEPDFYKKEEIYQALLFTKENEAAYLDSFPDVSFIRWHELSLDIVPKGGSKAKGIRQLISRLDFKMENVYAFGDGMNDIEMLQEVGMGIAMGNGHEVVKLCADYVTTNVENDGIVNGLKYAGLLEKSFKTIK